MKIKIKVNRTYASVHSVYLSNNFFFYTQKTQGYIENSRKQLRISDVKVQLPPSNKLGLICFNESFLNC